MPKLIEIIKRTYNIKLIYRVNVVVIEKFTFGLPKYFDINLFNPVCVTLIFTMLELKVQ